MNILLNFVPKGQTNNIIWNNDGKFTDAYMSHSISIS